MPTTPLTTPSTALPTAGSFTGPTRSATMPDYRRWPPPETRSDHRTRRQAGAPWASSMRSTCGDVLHQLVAVLLQLADPALHHVPDADDPAQERTFDHRDVTDPPLGPQVHDRLDIVHR